LREMSESNRHILFVDDEQLVLDALRRTLRPWRDAWEMTFVDCPEDAWQRMRTTDFDVVVIDVEMPSLGGLELLDRIGRSEWTKDIPVLMLTGSLDHRLKRQALDRGASDLLNKPIDGDDLVARLRSAVRLKSYRDCLKDRQALLEEKVRERAEELAQSRLDMIWRLGKVAEQRDEETGYHVIRVGFICRAIGQAMGMDRQAVETLFLAAPLHDIGKIGIPDAVLLKPGPLDPKEWAIMKQHCRIGARILSEESKVRAAFSEWRGPIPGDSDQTSRNPFLETAASIALAHHERWDGSGYPRGFRGEAIPLEARIVAIADVFDALGSERPYKKAIPEPKALEMIADQAGKHFDPSVYASFMEALPEIKAIRDRLADTLETTHEKRYEADPVR